MLIYRVLCVSLLLLFELCGPATSFSFAQHHTITRVLIPFVPRRSTRSITTRFSSNEELSGPGDSVSAEEFSLASATTSTNLWLDLRGTAVHPKVAIDYLVEELAEYEIPGGIEMQFLIDRVLLSDAGFQNLVNSSDPFLESFEILYVPNDDESMVALSKTGLSIPFGRLESMPIDSGVAVADPMQAMATLTGGKWILLNNAQEGADEKKDILRLEAIGNFLDIASTATSGDWGSTIATLEGGLLLRGDSEQEKSDDCSSGGVAVVCGSKSAVVQLASIFQCFQSGSSTSTESGILLHDISDTSGPAVPTALILPFDLLLWKTALLVYGPK